MTNGNYLCVLPVLFSNWPVTRAFVLKMKHPEFLAGQLNDAQKEKEPRDYLITSWLNPI
jgi:hypothetical protein